VIAAGGIGDGRGIAAASISEQAAYRSEPVYFWPRSARFISNYKDLVIKP
jgi:hypothetical protein